MKKEQDVTRVNMGRRGDRRGRRSGVRQRELNRTEGSMSREYEGIIGYDLLERVETGITNNGGW